MMLKVELNRYGSFGTKDKYENMDWKVFAALWPLAPEEKPENEYSLNCGPTMISAVDAQLLVDAGFVLTILPHNSLMQVKLQDQRKWEYGEQVTPRDLMNGDAVQITIPDMALMYIDEVTWLDDACTEMVQDHLNEGWRILAVCPPNAQRRPDYILGRRKRRDD